MSCMKGGEEEDKKRERKIKVQPSLFFISALALIMVKLLQAGGTDRLQKYLLFLLFYVNPDTFFFFCPCPNTPNNCTYSVAPRLQSRKVLKGKAVSENSHKVTISVTNALLIIYKTGC